MCYDLDVQIMLCGVKYVYGSDTQSLFLCCGAIIVDWETCVKLRKCCSYFPTIN